MFSIVYQHARQTKEIYSLGIKVLPIYGVPYVSLKNFFLSIKLVAPLLLLSFSQFLPVQNSFIFHKNMMLILRKLLKNFKQKWPL